MIKKLRKKFILVTFLSISIILFLIISISGAINYVAVENNANLIMEVLKENEGILPENSIPKSRFWIFSNEVFYETKYFSILLDKDGNVIKIIHDENIIINKQYIKELATKLNNKEVNEGRINKINYSSIMIGENKMYIFVDYRKSHNLVNRFILSNYLLSYIGLSIFFVILLAFSKVITKPVEQTFDKQKLFITNASHDIKTPLTIIGVDTELIEMEHGESQWTKDIKNQVNRLTSLTNKLVFLAKIEEDGFKLNNKEINLSSIIKEITDNFEVIAISQNKILTCDISDNITCIGDEDMIIQMFYLLLDNSIKYSSKEGNIFVSLKMKNKQIEIIITNDVDDIKVGKHNNYFERFYRSDSSRNSSTGGHGIGLSVVKTIVELHKGSITCESENNKSINFKIIL